MLLLDKEKQAANQISVPLVCKYPMSMQTKPIMAHMQIGLLKQLQYPIGSQFPFRLHC